jgi:hypothetical protein
MSGDQTGVLRMPYLRSTLAAAALALSVTAGAAWANPIPVYSTGNGSTTDGYADPNWSYTLVNNTGDGPSSGSSAALVLANYPVDFCRFPCGGTFGDWVANSTAGAWIGDNTSNDHSGYNSGNNGGSESYSTTFSMAGLAPSTAQITGQWTVDDAGELELNGNIISTLSTGNWGSLFSFSAPSSDFIAGANTLTVVLTNSDDSWEGTQVQITSATADPAVPEPLSPAMFGTGLAGLGLLRRRGRR